MAFGKKQDGSGPVTPPDPKERRDTGRTAVYRNAELYFSGSQVPCIARDVSEKGCLIGLEAVETLPDQVEIRLNTSLGLRAAQIVWREDNEAGLEFVT